MKIVKAIVTASLIVSLFGCNKAAEPPADTSTQPAASASPVANAEDPASKTVSLEPVKEGDHFVFTDPNYGYSLKFTDDFHFNANPELQEELKKTMHDTMNMDLPSSVGLRFFIFRYEPDSVPFNPNMNCTVEQVAPSAGDLDTEKYTGFARQQLASQLKATFEGESVPVDVNGTEFYRTDYKFVLPGANLPLKARVYSYYDPSTRVAYGFTIGTTQDDDSDDVEELDKVFQTLQMPK